MGWGIGKRANSQSFLDGFHRELGNESEFPEPPPPHPLPSFLSFTYAVRTYAPCRVTGCSQISGRRVW